MFGSTTTANNTGTDAVEVSPRMFIRRAALGLVGVLDTVPLAVAPTTGTTHAYNTGVEKPTFACGARWTGSPESARKR